MESLLLFDIDGTLVDTGGAGMRALTSAMLEEFALHERAGDFPSLDLAGSTDSGVVRLLFGHFEITLEPENVERFYARYHIHLRRELSTWGRRHGRILPGVSQLIDRLHRDENLSDRHALGLLTGNIARGAWTKVATYGLEGVFGFGAFGDDHHDRNELGPIAIERAALHTGKRFESNRVFIIGDTPKDIRCARACGAWAVAVATGKFNRPQLEEHEPDLLFDDFDDADHFVAEVERLMESEK
ncbi:MAG: haloacid dehalogenase-like hydrolase [Verrucomicrobiae bacterium]|nr:haloacid dehalogenase-like hydrolase [Verrucomicrobiae bacterium]